MQKAEPGQDNEELVTRWARRRTELATLHALVDGAALIDQFLADLGTINSNETPVSLAEASRKTGYTPDHLSRLIRTGRLVSYGRRNAPQVRVSECPRKLSRLANSTGGGYDPNTDARSLRVRR